MREGKDVSKISGLRKPEGWSCNKMEKIVGEVDFEIWEKNQNI